MKKKLQKTKLIFPIVWIDRTQRNYDSAFSKKLSAIMDRFDVGIQWDINPPLYIEVDFLTFSKEDEPPSDKLIEMLVLRVIRFMEKQRNLGVIK